MEAYTLSLAQDETSIFAKNIHNFIACTRESKERIPQKVMRNMRQFMNGMKNYLVKHGEKDFGIEVEKARAALKPDEFLNLDAILEGVMHQLVIMPLREHLYELFVDYYGSRGDIELIINNMKYAENKEASAFGVKVSKCGGKLGGKWGLEMELMTTIDNNKSAHGIDSHVNPAFYSACRRGGGWGGGRWRFRD